MIVAKLETNNQKPKETANFVWKMKNVVDSSYNAFFYLYRHKPRGGLMTLFCQAQFQFAIIVLAFELSYPSYPFSYKSIGGVLCSFLYI